MDTMSFAAYLATFLPLLAGLVNPAVASFLSREHFPELATQSITVGLVAAESFAAEFLQAGNYSLSKATLVALASYVISAEARSQFWKNTKTNAKLLAFPNKLGVEVSDVSSVDAASLVRPIGVDEIPVAASSLLGPDPTSKDSRRPKPTASASSLPPELQQLPVEPTSGTTVPPTS